MIENVRLLSQELEVLGYRTQRFDCSIPESRGEGIKFEYEIADGSRTGDTVLLGLVIPEAAGAWPEVTPHWVHISPPDSVLEEQVKAKGTAKRYSDDRGVEWMAISAPVKDFWDKIDMPNGKNAETYIKRHIRRIWDAR